MNRLQELAKDIWAFGQGKPEAGWEKPLVEDPTLLATDYEEPDDVCLRPPERKEIEPLGDGGWAEKDVNEKVIKHKPQPKFVQTL